MFANFKILIHNVFNKIIISPKRKIIFPNILDVKITAGFFEFFYFAQGE